MKLIAYGTAKRKDERTGRVWYLSSLGVRRPSLVIKDGDLQRVRRTHWRHLRKPHSSKTRAALYAQLVVRRYRKLLEAADREAHKSDGS